MSSNRLRALSIALAFSLLASSVGPVREARASLRTPAPSIADAKALVSALDKYFELGREASADAASDGAPIDRAKMAQGLADGLARLAPEQFNGISRKLVTDYLESPGRRAELEAFIGVLGDSVSREFRGQVAGLGASAAEDALILVTVVGTLHGSSYALDGALSAGGRLASRLGRTKAFQGVVKAWTESRVARGVSVVPMLVWNLMVTTPHKVIHAGARAATRNWKGLYSSVAGLGVGIASWQLYQKSRMNPREILTVAQLGVIAAAEARLSELAAGEGSTPESERGFEDPAFSGSERMQSELARIEAELNQLLASPGDGVKEAAERALERLSAQSAGLNRSG